jgi:hypothetical protein
VPSFDLERKLSFSITCCDAMDLPKFDESKKLTCPGTTAIKDVVLFAHGKVQFDKHMIVAGPFDPLKHIEITLPVVRPVAHGEEAKIDFISLP